MLRTGWILLAASACLAQVTADDHAILDAARRTALAFVATLPDFVCAQSIRRFRSPANADSWRQADLLQITLSYLNGQEDYQLVSINDRPADQSYDTVVG